MDLSSLLPASIAILIYGAVWAIKQTNLVSNRFLPLLALVLGAVLGSLSSLGSSVTPLIDLVVAGAVTGLAATGFDQLVSTTIKNQ